jgi:ureidoglycolate hydrolase
MFPGLGELDDKPDLSTLRAFTASSTQGINYGPGIWRAYFILTSKLSTSPLT